MIESEDDRLAFLDDDEFATLAELPFKTVNVIFDSEYLPVDVFDHQVQTTTPVIFGRTSDVGDLRNGDPVTVIDPTTSLTRHFFVAEGPQDDGTGMTLVRLRK